MLFVLLFEFNRIISRMCGWKFLLALLHELVLLYEICLLLNSPLYNRLVHYILTQVLD